MQYSDIDYMERQLDFTLDAEFAGFPALITRMAIFGPVLDKGTVSGQDRRWGCMWLRTQAFFHIRVPQL